MSRTCTLVLRLSKFTFQSNLTPSNFSHSLFWISYLPILTVISSLLLISKWHVSWYCFLRDSLLEKCTNTKFFLVCIFPHSDRIRIRKNSLFGRFSRSDYYQTILIRHGRFFHQYYQQQYMAYIYPDNLQCLYYLW